MLIPLLREPGLRRLVDARWSGADNADAREILDDIIKNVDSNVGAEDSVRSPESPLSIPAAYTICVAQHDLNEFLCAKCDRPGEVLCCDFCPLVYHMSCIGLTESELPPGEWMCPACTTKARRARREDARLRDARARRGSQGR